MSEGTDAYSLVTLLPYPDFDESIHVLDRNKLLAQRVEAWKILQINIGFRWTTNMREPISIAHTYGWNHPGCAMWRGHSRHLAAYLEKCCRAWTTLYDGDDTILPRLKALPEFFKLPAELEEPEWLGLVDLHKSHQSSLVRRDKEHYSKFFPDVPDDLEYVWPCTTAQRPRVNL